MTKIELDNWFCSLSVRQKEHIACKVILKQGGDVKNGLYPNCANVWMNLEDEHKCTIHEHCTDRHGMWVEPEREDVNIFSY